MTRLFTLLCAILACCYTVSSYAACNTTLEEDFLSKQIEPQDQPMLEFYYASQCRASSVNYHDVTLPDHASATSQALYYFGLANLKKYQGIKTPTIPDLAALGRSSNNEWIVAEAKLNEAQRLIDSDLLLQAEYLLHEVVPIARELGYKRLLARTYRWLGNIKVQRSNIKASLSYYKTAFELVSEIGDEFQSTMTMNNIATVYMHSGEWDQANTYIKRAMKLYSENSYSNSLFEAIMHINSSAIYFAKGDNNKAEKYMSMALKEAQQTGSNKIKTSTLSKMSMLYSKIGRPVEALSMAENCVIQAQSSAKPEIMLATCYEAYSEAFLIDHQYQSAIEYAHKVLDYLTTSESQEIIWEMDVLTKLVTAHESLGQYQQALEFSKRKSKVRERFYRQTYSEGILSEKSSLERKLSKREVELLAAQNQLQEITLKEQRSREILYGALFIIIGYFAIRVFLRLKRTNSELVSQNTTDSLTGAHNRRFLESWLKQKPASIPGGLYAICVLDIDYFKQFNDKYGHDIGDVVLKETVMVLKRSLRKNDLLVRWGGEEFVLLLPMESLAKLEETLERLRANVENHHVAHQDSQFSITISIGASTSHKDQLSTNWESVFAQADSALYQAKNAGRNGFKVYNNESLSS